MRFDVLTLFPEFVQQSMATGVVGRAMERELIQLRCWNPRDFATDNYRTIDHRPYGGGPGMVFLIDPLKDALHAAQAERQGELAPVVLMSPQGRTFDQTMAQAWSKLPAITFVCGRYEGIDERFIERYVDQQVSLGDFVLSGGELAALAMMDAVTRLLPGVLHTAASAQQDSFMDGLLDCPHYTRPEEAAEGAVPAVLLSGNHAMIANWRRQQSLGRTWLRRPELLGKISLSKQDSKLLAAFIAEHRRQIGVQ